MDLRHHCDDLVEEALDGGDVRLEGFERFPGIRCQADDVV